MTGPQVIACGVPYGMGGLGRHLAEVVEEARALGQLRCYFATTVAPSDPAGQALGLRWFPLLARYTPARWNMGWRSDLSSLEFDRAVAARLTSGDRFVGFAGMAWRSFQRARALGYRYLQLESPTAHILHVWNQHTLVRRMYPIETDWLSRRQVRQVLAEYALADEIVVTSRYSWDTFVKAGIPETRLRRRDLTVDPRFRPPDTPSQEPGFRVVAVGSLTATKGIPVLIEAFRCLKHADASLTLVGGSGSRGMRRYLEQCRSQDPRVQAGPGDPLPHLWRAHVLVHPSFQDGFGYAPLEALACGVPVIVTDQTGMKERIQPGVNGWIVPAGDVSALTERLQWCADSSDCQRLSLPDVV